MGDVFYTLCQRESKPVPFFSAYASYLRLSSQFSSSVHLYTVPVAVFHHCSNGLYCNNTEQHFKQEA